MTLSSSIAIVAMWLAPVAGIYLTLEPGMGWVWVLSYWGTQAIVVLVEEK
jgi:hypothetical protein